MNPGAKVRFRSHGETGLVMTVIARDENDHVTLQDPHGRILNRTPIELLAPVPADPEATERINPSPKAWREVDELEM